ncbi:MAG: rRNA cytosine-C5-methyltransferase [Bacteroidales bacterium]
MELHPDFISQIEKLFPNEYGDILKSVSKPAETSVRINQRKYGCDANITDYVPWCKGGGYLSERPQFTYDVKLHRGSYYVQDASSMILDYVAKRLCAGGDVVRYLDLCAAPGGKSTAVINSLPKGSLMVSNEIIGSRAQILKENIIKWGSENCVVCNDDSARLGELTHYFDIIAADVPCSGEGMFRKDAQAVEQWSLGLVKECVERQRMIIDNIWDALKPNGYLIYSTCTFNSAENEEIVDYILENFDAETIDMEIAEEWGIRQGLHPDKFCYRFMPHMTRGEGLFLAVIRKGDGVRSDRVESMRKRAMKGFKVNSLPQAQLSMVKNWLLDSDRFKFMVEGDDLLAIESDWFNDMVLLKKSLHVIHSGVYLAKIKGKDLIPSQGLALSCSLNMGAWECVDVDYKTAIDYLRSEAIVVDSAIRSFLLLTYEGEPLGFVKNLGNRANNLYPKEWRIRSSYAPDAPPNII